MAICSNCKAELKPGKKFCTNCGTAVNDPATEAAVPTNTAPAKAKSGKIATLINKRLFWPVFIGIIVGLLFPFLLKGYAFDSLSELIIKVVGIDYGTVGGIVGLILGGIVCAIIGPKSSRSNGKNGKKDDVLLGSGIAGGIIRGILGAGGGIVSTAFGAGGGIFLGGIVGAIVGGIVGAIKKKVQSTP